LLHVLDEQARGSEGEFDPHHLLSRVLGKISTEWGPSEKRYEVRSWVHSLTLVQAQQVLDEITLSEEEEDFINGKLAQAGDDLRILDGALVPRDEVGEALGLLDLTDEPTALLVGQFGPVLRQYQRALDSLNAHPMEQEKAISEAMGALEAVVRLAGGGGKDFGPNIRSLVQNEAAWTRLLGTAISQLQGYRSQVPGAGHGRYVPSDVSDAETQFFVRTCGAAIAWIIQDHQLGRW
jgi:hypothetical protein